MLVNLRVVLNRIAKFVKGKESTTMRTKSKVLLSLVSTSIFFVVFIIAHSIGAAANTYTVDDVLSITATPKSQGVYEQYAPSGTIDCCLDGSRYFLGGNCYLGYYGYSGDVGYSSVYYLNDNVLFGDDFQYTVTLKSGEIITGDEHKIYNTIGHFPRIVHKEFMESSQNSGRKTADIYLGDVVKGSFEFEFKQPSNPVVSISVKNYTKKILIDYIQDESHQLWNNGQLWYVLAPQITVTYKDGTTKVVGSHCGVRYGWEKTSVSPGTYPVTIYYHGAKTTFQVEVVENPVKDIALIQKPDRITPMVGEYPNPIGAIIRVYLRDGSYQDVPITRNNFIDFNYFVKLDKSDLYGKFVVDSQPFSATGSKTITLSYFGKTCSYEVSVVENTIKKLVLKRDCSDDFKCCVITYENGKEESLNSGCFLGYWGWAPYTERTGADAPEFLFQDRIFPCSDVYKGNGVYLSYSRSDEPAPAHNYGGWNETKAETCIAAATESRKCTVCNKTQSRVGDAATGVHTFGDWKKTKAPTTTSAGEETRKCNNCTETETRSIPKLISGSGTSGTGTSSNTSDKTTNSSTGTSSTVTDTQANTDASDTPFVPPVIDIEVNSTNPEENALGGNIGGTADDLKDAILTDEEKDRVKNGEALNVFLKVADIAESILEIHKEMIRTEAGNATVGAILDISLFKQIGDDEVTSVTTTSKAVVVTITVPEDLRNADTALRRTYFMVHLHGEIVERIPAQYDSQTGALTFETDGFSTYALVYEDVAVENSDANTDSSVNSATNLPTPTDDASADKGGFPWWIVIACGVVILAAGGVALWYFLIFKKKPAEPKE